ncbi:hypothetical protein [Streptomyces chattanoogensis]|uniref:hypothetical protein n=1 Tax=Streptomyces chattanoogensis TaxID=66876 RepID=UPI0036B00353
MNSRRALLMGATAAVFVSSGVLAGCSSPSMEVDEAVKKMDAAMDDTFAAVHPSLKWSDGPAGMSQHRDLLNREDGEITVARNRYVRTKVSKPKIAVLAKAVEKNWKAKGYELEYQNRKVPSFSYGTPEGVSVKFDVRGEILIISAAISDTKYPGHSGDIDDGDYPNGLDLDDTVPNVTDPYWSK